jgi:hypothetical protein
MASATELLDSYLLRLNEHPQARLSLDDAEVCIVLCSKLLFCPSATERTSESDSSMLYVQKQIESRRKPGEVLAPSASGGLFPSPFGYSGVYSISTMLLGYMNEFVSHCMRC